MLDVQTALHYAADQGHRDVLKLLLAAGASPKVCIFIFRGLADDVSLLV